MRRREGEKARAELDAATADEARLEAELKELRATVQQLRSDVSSQQSQGGIVRALMAAKSAGHIKGVYGRLGE